MLTNLVIFPRKGPWNFRIIRGRDLRLTCRNSIIIYLGRTFSPITSQGGHLPNFCTRVCQRGLRNGTLSVAIFLEKTGYRSRLTSGLNDRPTSGIPGPIPRYLLYRE